MRNEYLYGYRSVAEAMRAERRKIHEVLASTGKTHRRNMGLIGKAEKKGIAVTYLSDQQMASRLGTSQHQGVGARVGPYPLVDFTALIDGLTGQNRHPLIVLLDGVVDPHNLGAVTRSALAAGADGVIIPKDRAAAPTPGASRASAGALEHIRLCRVANLVRAVKSLQHAGIWVYALQMASEQHIYSTDLTGPIAVVVGGEEKGIRSLVLAASDGSISIPQVGPVASLNASAAASIVLFEIVRQKRLKVNTLLD